MVLHHVAQCTGALIIAGALLKADRLGYGDLDIVDPAGIPHGFEEGIAEAQCKDVLDRFLAEIMVDSEGPFLGKDRGDRVVDLPARGEVVAERLFEPDPHIVAGKARSLKALDGRFEQGWRGREEDGEPAGDVTDLFGERLKPLDPRSVERLVAKTLEKALDRLFVLAILGQELVERGLCELPIAWIVMHGTGSARDRQPLRQQPVGVQAVE